LGTQPPPLPLHTSASAALNAAGRLITDVALHAVKALTGVAPTQVRVEEDPDWGHVYIVTLDAKASEALRINLELQKMMPGMPVVVEWTGPTDVGDDELLERLVEIAHAGGFRAKAPKGLDAVRDVAEGRDRWPT